MAYVYRHIRLDKNEPFYIGVGIKESDTSYKRARSPFGRNPIWNLITQKTDYNIEILFDGLTIDEVFEKEKEFIALYGRIDLKTGSLANLTEGGEGKLGCQPSEETRRRIGCGGRKYEYKIETPSKEILLTDNLTIFCKTHDLIPQNLQTTLPLKNKRRVGLSHKGYCIVETKNLETGEIIIKARDEALKIKRKTLNFEYSVLTVNGVVEIVRDVTNFAKKYNLEKSALYSTTPKKDGRVCSHHKGFVILKRVDLITGEVLEAPFLGKKVTRYIHFIQTPTKEVVEVLNIRPFCKENSLGNGNLYKTIQTGKTHKGYKILYRTELNKQQNN